MALFAVMEIRMSCALTSILLFLSCLPQLNEARNKEYYNSNTLEDTDDMEAWLQDGEGDDSNGDDSDGRSLGELQKDGEGGDDQEYDNGDYRSPPYENGNEKRNNFLTYLLQEEEDDDDTDDVTNGETDTATALSDDPVGNSNSDGAQASAQVCRYYKCRKCRNRRRRYCRPHCRTRCYRRRVCRRRRCRYRYCRWYRIVYRRRSYRCRWRWRYCNRCYYRRYCSGRVCRNKCSYRNSRYCFNSKCRRCYKTPQVLLPRHPQVKCSVYKHSRVVKPHNTVCCVNRACQYCVRRRGLTHRQCYKNYSRKCWNC